VRKREKTNRIRIRAYTLRVNYGHAPCWEFDSSEGCEVLTIANCKWPIREKVSEGEWVAGVTPSKLGSRLAFLMKVEHKVPRAEYWKRYLRTRPDSIYEPSVQRKWRRHENPWHTNHESFKDDLKSDWVLWSKTFYFFAQSYDDYSKSPTGLRVGNKCPQLHHGGMRGYGKFVDVLPSFIDWVKEQKRMKRTAFNLLDSFENDSCSCCH
jgi:hypothetical protein